VVFFGSLLFSSCTEEMSSRLNPIPKALGLANHITVIADNNLWESDMRDTFEYYFQAAYPILPQPEPLFDLKHYTYKDIAQSTIKRELRTYVAVGYNRWAKNQLVIYLFGKNREDLMTQIVQQFPAIAKRVNKFDEEKIYSLTYLAKSSTRLNSMFKENYNATIDVPADYFLALHEDKTMWFRKETDFISFNLMITEVPYRNEEQLKKSGQKAIMDSLGLKYVSTEIDATYKKINDVDLPMLAEASNLGNSYAIETRGIWEIENDFMGGPFLSYGVLSPDKKRILLLEGFVHAPGKEKRKYMQQMEVILQSFRFDIEQ